MITERDIAVLRALARYFVLNREQLQRLCFANDDTGRITRRRLRELCAAGIINRQPLAVHNMDAGTPPLAYYPSRRGLELLAEHSGDDRVLLVSTQAPQPYHVAHWIAVSETHITIDAAIAAQTQVRLEGWYNEWDTVSSTETALENRYRIYTLLREQPRLVCAPDSAFMLSLGGHKKVFYLEQDMNSSGVRRIAASKTPGYAEMARRELHRRHFPDATVATFLVLAIAPTARRRDALRHAIRNKPGADCWRFIASPELKPETFLHAPIFFSCEGGGAPLMKATAKPEPALTSMTSADTKHVSESEPKPTTEPVS